MSGLGLAIAVRHLLARRRQSVVSLLGIVLGVGFFLSISALMQGSEDDFIARLIDNSPHITIQDKYRSPHRQPAEDAYAGGAVQVLRVKPETETRGIRGYQRVLAYLRSLPGVTASPVLDGQALVSFAGQDKAIALSGMIPAEIDRVSTIGKYMTAGRILDLAANPDGIVIGDQLAKDLSLQMGENLTVSATTGQTRTFKIVGLFHTGRANVDDGQAFVALKRVQALLGRANRVNSIIVKLSDPGAAQTLAARIEARIGYKSVSWQEASEDIMSLLLIRKVLMYAVVSAVLVVAAFGIYNVISTVVLEKQRDIAILKSMGFHARDILRLFLAQGAMLGAAGCAAGLPFGAALMVAITRISFRMPGSRDLTYMPVSWNWVQFAMAASFAMAAALLAAVIPARKAAQVDPVDVLRGGT
ncbi:MAG TPA: ABC transporter permease [Rhizomicrobium sp.]|nr:ABC transporter permease [Rhizomicrobium sp.]